MELNYIKEHTSCVNYKTEEYSGFSLGQALTGENFDNQEQVFFFIKRNIIASVDQFINQHFNLFFVC